MSRYHPLPVIFALLLGTCLSAASANDNPEIDDLYHLCPPPVVPLLPATPFSDQATHIRADRLQAEGNSGAHFIGRVETWRGDTLLQGDTLHYRQDQELLELQGNLRVRTPTIALSGSRGRFWRERDRGEIEQAEFIHLPLHAFGHAEQIVMEGNDWMQLQQASFTTCNPGVLGWQLQAESITLDQRKNEGAVYDATLQFGDLPLLWLPYINFPLSGRKSGFLAPKVGASEDNGSDLTLPWYWNIAPNRDATLTPRLMSQRGAMLQSEYRYLERNSNGILHYHLLPRDQRTGERRSLIDLTHQHRFGHGWHLDLRFREVSDENYFIDFGSGITTSSETHLERQLTVRRRVQQWQLLGRIEDYQSLNSAEPYRRAPQLQIQSVTTQRPNRFNQQITADLTHFQHRGDLTTGSRLDLQQQLTLPIRRTAWFLTPQLTLRHTEYRIDGTDSDTVRRTLPISSIDGGLIFERQLTLLQQPLLQTLEPRIYYLYVPYHDQQAIPLFDSGAYTFGFSSLFRDNRFSGRDRIGDANQLTVALSSRLLNSGSGRELIAASIGQIHYLQDQRVTLHPDEPVIAAGESDYLAEVSGYPHRHLNLAATLRWDPKANREQQLSSRLEYRPSRRERLFVSYRYERDALQQSDIALFWPINRRWQLLTRLNHDLATDRNLDTAFGFEYESCCWAFRTLWRATRNGGETLDRSIYFTLSLKGLGQLGQPLETELERDILGYSAP